MDTDTLNNTPKKEIRPNRAAENVVPEKQEKAVAAASVFGTNTLWLSGALVAATVVVFAGVLHFGFLSFDDPEYITENPMVTHGLTREAVRWSLTTGYFSSWHPLTWLSYLLDVQLFGLNPHGFHLMNLLLHIGSVLLLFGVLSAMTGARGRSALVAALFAIHPLHVESVAWISERKDVLSAFLWMLGLWAYLRYVRRPKLSRYVAIMIILAAGLAAKAMLVTFPFALLLLDFWPLRRFAPEANFPEANLSNRSGSEPSEVRPLKPWLLICEKMPLLVMAVAGGFAAYRAQQEWGSVIDIPLGMRIANALVSYVKYIWQMFWPAHLAAFYPFPSSIPAWRIAGSLIILIGITLLAIGNARRRPYFIVGWLWYLGTIAPVIGLISQVGEQAMADRYSYIPLIGLFIIIAWGAHDLLQGLLKQRIQGSRYPSRAGSLVAIAVLAAYGAAAWRQVQYWKSDADLWGHALQATSQNYFAHNNLGLALADEGRSAEARVQYLAALRLKPDFPEAHINLGRLLASEGDLGEARSEFEEARRIRPSYEDAYFNLGNVLAREGRVDEAIGQFSAALNINPLSWRAHNNLAALLERQGKLDAASLHYQEALRLNPNFADAYNNLANVLIEQGKFSDAANLYAMAIRIKPDYAEAHNGLGIALAREGRSADAAEEYKAAIRINPNYAKAHRNLGAALESQGKTDAAMEQYMEALRIQPAQPDVHYEVAVLLNKSGDFRGAIRQLQDTLNLKPEDTPARQLLEQLKKRGAQ